MVASLIGQGIGALLSFGARRAESKDKAEANVAAQQTGVSDQLGKEFGHKQNWFDSLIDGLNRLPRPMIVLWVLWILSMSYTDTHKFAEVMAAMSLTPEWLAIIFAQIILLFFGGRMLENFKGFNSIPMKQFQETLGVIKEIRESKVKHETAIADLNARINPPSAPTLADAKPFLSDDNFKKEMADESKPLSNAAILEWNRRRQANSRGT